MPISIFAAAGRHIPGRRSFLTKAVCALALVVLADLLFFGQGVGWTAGLFSLAWVLAVAIARPGVLAGRPSLAALAAASLFALTLIDDPGTLAFVLVWAALSLAVLLPHLDAFDDAWAWTCRLAIHPFSSLLRLAGDAVVWTRAWRRAPLGLRRVVPLLALPVAGTGLFLALFASANPVIRDTLASLDPGALFRDVTPVRVGFWALTGATVWGVLRPGHLLRLAAPAERRPPSAIPGVSTASVTLSLIAFNALFALQNTLDVAYLWSGAPLPGDLTLAKYAHRGAYPLIATALLAAVFVLVALRPGSPLAANRLLRRLVYLWIGQNVVLVGFSIERTMNYVGAFSLTALRLAALIWMGLVAVGLVLICWRLWRRRSTAWLINANAIAALSVLMACTVVDLGAVAASYNVRHNKAVTGSGPELDLCYLRNLGPAALLPLVELAQMDLPVETRNNVQGLRRLLMAELEEAQADWHRWTFRNARRLDTARAAIAAQAGSEAAFDEHALCFFSTPL
jgi:hypothetical protein